MSPSDLLLWPLQHRPMVPLQQVRPALVWVSNATRSHAWLLACPHFCRSLSVAVNFHTPLLCLRHMVWQKRIETSVSLKEKNRTTEVIKSMLIAYTLVTPSLTPPLSSLIQNIAVPAVFIVTPTPEPLPPAHVCAYGVPKSSQLFSSQRYRSAPYLPTLLSVVVLSFTKKIPFFVGHWRTDLHTPALPSGCGTCH